MVQEIDAERTQEMIQDKDVVLIDVLGPMSYNEHRLPGAVNVPVKHPEFEREMEEAIPSKEATVVVYCANLDCQASPTAAKKLESLGYTDVYDFEAGLQGWEDAGFTFEGEGADRIAERQAGDAKEEAERDDEARDKGGGAATRREGQDRKGKEGRKKPTKGEDDRDVKKGDVEEAVKNGKKEGYDDEVHIDDIETRMQAR